MSIRPNWLIIIFDIFISLPTFCLIFLSITVRGMLKSVRLIEELPILTVLLDFASCIFRFCY